MRFFKLYAALDSFTLDAENSMFADHIIIQAVCLKDVIKKAEKLLNIDGRNNMNEDNTIQCITMLVASVDQEKKVFTRFDVVNNVTIKNEYPR